MPTENRSSNTEMVSAAPPKRQRIYVEVRECEGCNHIGIDDAHCTLGACHECDWSGPEPVEDKCPGCGRENVIAAACPDCGSRYALAASKEFEMPAPQPHPEPIAWMVGTAIWWTKEEAERDAAATGLPIVGLGPMTDSGEVEQLREVIKHSDEQIMRQSLRISNQRAKLAERNALLRDIASGYWELAIELPADLLVRLQALSASAEPSVPGKQGAQLGAVRAPEIQDLLDRAATAIGQYGDSLLGRGQREDSVDLLDLEREVRDLEQQFKGAFAQPST